ncbi:40-kDa huntingtin-associated protein [Leptopilina boulardi]|uniref:40-kDa huntingtin-associated protein n=1 Tax=Leptopilina boulardi TaxID=63433 RepID=UPI0021F61AFC|nr:40-kDa huntingtin-associated protein [Leptopilina boulardi]
MANQIHSIGNSDYHNDLLTKYHVISAKLKKRFLRKPNVTEASEQFDNLAIECDQKELCQYAGLCWLAAARCQGTLGNVLAEINFLTKAGRSFIIAKNKNNQIGCSYSGEENLQAAINCFGHALTRCQSQEGFSMMSASLAMELASALDINGISNLRKSVEIHPTLRAINTLSSYYIKQDDYAGALHVLTELVEFLTANNVSVRTSGSYMSILQRCEMTRVLLLLILQPTPQRLSHSQAQVLEKYAWIEENSNIGFRMDENEMLLLQSLVLACQSRDYQALLELEGELWSIMNIEQKGLLNKLLQTFNKD